jgi:hypothetical protein
LETRRDRNRQREEKGEKGEEKLENDALCPVNPFSF